MRVVRFRLGGEMREGMYREEERKKVCRICGEETETCMGKMQRVERKRRDVAGTSRQDSGRRGRGRDMDERAGRGEEELRRRRGRGMERNK